MAEPAATDTVEIIDGADRVDISDKDHPSIDDLGESTGDIPEVEEIEELEVEEFGDRESVLEDISEEDEEEDDESDSESAQEEPEVDRAEYLREVNRSTATLSDYRGQLERINRTLEAGPPSKPDDEYDDQKMIVYHSRVASWEDKKEQAKNDREYVNDLVRKESVAQEKIFREAHPNEDLKAFEEFIRKDDELYLLGLSGKKSIETLYKYYQAEEGKVDQDRDKLKKLKKQGAKFKPVKTKGAKKTVAVGASGIPKKFQYANKPEFKKYVADLKAKKHDMRGNRLTPARIDALCKQEFMQSKGIPQI